jgi:hypothetical protein
MKLGYKLLISALAKQYRVSPIQTFSGCVLKTFDGVFSIIGAGT